MTEAVKSTPNKKLRRERERRCWSQQEVADLVGTTPLNVGRWERGITLPGSHFRQKLCEVFEKTAQELDLVPENVATDKATEVSLNVPAISLPQEIPTSLWNVPYNRNLYFTGREDILMHLHDAFLNGQQPIALTQPQAISGLGGIGKTQTAVEYAYRYRDSYDAVLWARADSHDLLISDFLLIAALLNLSQRNEQDQSVVVKAVLRWFDMHERWLLILDNADNLEMTSEFIPTVGKGHVLLTTRINFTGTVAQRIELDTMGLEEGALFLLRRAKLFKGTTPSLKTVPEAVRSQARAIVEAVDGLPLALDQAGAYVEETGCSLNDYLKFYRTRRGRLLRMRGRNATGHPEPVATTWALSFERIERANPSAAELLRLCAFLHPDEIPEAMIVDGAPELDPILQPVAEDELELNEAIGELHKYSLVKRDPELKLLNIHRLVQAVIKDAMDKETQRQWAERTVLMVNRAYPEVTFENWERCQQCIPHAQVCAQWIAQYAFTSPEAARLLHGAGFYLCERAQYVRAEPLLKRALVLQEQVLGPEHLETARTFNALAELYLNLGKYDQAEQLIQPALAKFERVLGSEHPEVAITLDILGGLYRYEGKFAQAEPLLQRALAIREQALGKSHPLVADSLNNLAALYSNQGKYVRAEPLYQHALALSENAKRPEDPDTGAALHNLANLYMKQGKYAQAEPLFQRALATEERALGSEHPDTADSLCRLGQLYTLQGKYAQAEPLLQRALAVLEQVLGPEHYYTILAQLSLAQLSQATGKDGQAESLSQQALASSERVLGPEHPFVAETLTSLAQLYTRQGHYQQAEQLLERALVIDEQALGPEQPQMAAVLSAQGYLALLQGREEQAEPLLWRTLAIREQALGNAHPDVARTLSHMARLYEKQGKHEQAQPLYQRALAIQEQALGPEHPDTVAVRANYTDLLGKMERLTEVVKQEGVE